MRSRARRRVRHVCGAPPGRCASLRRLRLSLGQQAMSQKSAQWERSGTMRDGARIWFQPARARSAVFLAFLTGAMGLAAAGCGGSGDRLTREELIEQADATCAEFDQQIEEVQEPESLEDIERYVQEIRPIVEEGTDELDALEPPEELEDSYDQWIEATRSGVEQFDELEEAAASGDGAANRGVFGGRGGGGEGGAPPRGGDGFQGVGGRQLALPDEGPAGKA